MSNLKPSVVEANLQKPGLSCMASHSENEAGPGAHPIALGIEQLSPDLRRKVLSRAWKDVNAVITECGQNNSSTAGEYDWSTLSQAVSNLPPNEKKVKAVAAFYEAIIAVLREEKSQSSKTNANCH